MKYIDADLSYDNRIQYDSVKSGIEAFASTYSFNIESKLFPQLTKEQQQLWKEEIEQAVIAGGENGIELARDNRYKENRTTEWNEEDEKEIDCIINILDRLGYEEFCKSSRDQDVEEERFYYKEIQCLKRLKSLRHSWKPSEEQMDELDCAAQGLQYRKEPLELLYQNLENGM